jgi:hypothetical protein
MTHASVSLDAGLKPAVGMRSAPAAIGMPQLLAAVRSEAAKRERPFSDAETRGWT